MNRTGFAMPTRNLKDCDCDNHTKLNNPTAIDHNDMGILDSPVIIGVLSAVGFLAFMTVVVSVWSIRRCYLNNKTRRSWEIPVVEKENEDESNNQERIRTFSGTRRDIYGGSLNNLKYASESKDIRVVVKRDLHSAYRYTVHCIEECPILVQFFEQLPPPKRKASLSMGSHTFLNHGDHNNTIISSLSATWSIQTLPQPRHPGEMVITKATDNPLYARPVIKPQRCASSNALYESADSLLSRGIQFEPFQYCRKNHKSQKESPVYERIIDFQKNPGTKSLGKNSK